MAATPDATPSTQSERKDKGMKAGVCTEFTVFAKIKPGHADALRELLAKTTSGSGDTAGNVEAVRQLGILHDARHVIFDNDTRYMFASVFDGTWDNYIDDFAKTVVGKLFDEAFSHTEGFPGVTDPAVKDWFIAHQEPAGIFVSAYPDLTVQQIYKDQRVDEAFQAVLDTPEFRAALDNPANAELRDTPAFQKLLEEASA
ncbi:hypothetical protein ACFVZJ_20495 [Streptomyces sp. NPDC058322]|jgi:hypothetical protein|uniref:hypothetical protein n=1 Tax=unclassified Streptomyces TaxID=2593676 RepID=UPI0033C15082